MRRILGVRDKCATTNGIWIHTQRRSLITNYTPQRSTNAVVSRFTSRRSSGKRLAMVLIRCPVSDYVSRKNIWTRWTAMLIQIPDLAQTCLLSLQLNVTGMTMTLIRGVIVVSDFWIEVLTPMTVF